MSLALRFAVSSALLAVAMTGCSHECTGPLEDVGKTCPATFDGNLDSLPCSSETDFKQVYACGDLILISTGPNLGGLRCSYDATSHALVGAETFTDTNSYCGGDSYTRSAGRLPPTSCFEAGPTAKRDCAAPLAECTGSLAEIGEGCPATFDGDLDAWQCPTWRENRDVYVCGAFVALAIESPRSHWPRCSYDAATHELVGAAIRTGSQTPCFWRSVGSLPPEACFATDRKSKYCSGDCTKPLAEFIGRCPATFDGDLGSLACATPLDFEKARTCGGLVVISKYGSDCSYDAASHALVGASAYDDTPTFCNGDAFSAHAGQQPSGACSASVERKCPGPCSGPLADVGQGCPATFAGDLAALPCTSVFDFKQAFECGDLAVISSSGGLACSYDMISHALVGARIAGETKLYCDASSTSKTAGRMPDPQCLAAPSSQQRTCPAAP